MLMWFLNLATFCQAAWAIHFYGIPEEAQLLGFPTDGKFAIYLCYRGIKQPTCTDCWKKDEEKDASARAVWRVHLQLACSQSLESGLGFSVYHLPI
jgi:hypothetical protein